MNTTSKIDHLSEDFIPTVAQWYLDNFSRDGTTLEQCEKKLRNRLNTDKLDMCFLYFCDKTAPIKIKEPIGTISLAANDIPKHPKLTPCISNLFVAEKFRKQKIGEHLIDFANQKLRKFGFEKAYLYTTNPTIHVWYEKLGWKIIAEDTIFDIKIRIMETKL